MSWEKPQGGGGGGAAGIDISCRVRNNAAISIPNNTTTALTFNTEAFDTDGMHSTVSNTGRITIATGGKYIIGYNLEFAGNVNGLREAFITREGVAEGANQLMGGDATINRLSSSILITAVAAEWFDVRVFQDSGGALNINSTGIFVPVFWATKILG